MFKVGEDGADDHIEVKVTHATAAIGVGHPRVPEYRPRWTGSTSAVISMARNLGAPVMLPMGNVAARISDHLTSSLTLHATVETIWCTLRKLWMPQSSSTVTLAGCAMRLKSLRTRSVIITFSARSLGSKRSRSAAAASAAASSWRGAVPLMGREVSRFPLRSRKHSGDAESMRTGPQGMSAEYGAAVFWTSAPNARSASKASGNRPQSSRQRFIS